MSDVRPEAEPTVQQRPNWQRRFTIGVIVVAALVILVLLARAFFPRWWAQRVGDQVNKSFIGGVWWGLFYGIIFTALPLLILRQALRRHRYQRRWRISFAVLAIILALPNLLTLSVVLGTGNASHAGQRIMDIEAPAFRWATLIGAIVGAAIALWTIYLLSSRRRRGKDLARMRRAESEKYDIRQARERADQAEHSRPEPQPVEPPDTPPLPPQGRA